MDINSKQRICYLVLQIMLLISAITLKPSEAKKEASEAHKANWRVWYTGLDNNDDGYVSNEDAETARYADAEMHRFTEETLERLMQWWEECVMRGQVTYPTVDEFVEMLSGLYRSMGSEPFKSMMETCAYTKFIIYDTNNDGFYNRREFKTIYLYHGHDGIANDNNAFQAFNPENGKIPIETLVNAWTDFVCTGKGLIVKDQLENEDI